jgi:hypothetical protein
MRAFEIPSFLRRHSLIGVLGLSAACGADDARAPLSLGDPPSVPAGAPTGSIAASAPAEPVCDSGSCLSPVSAVQGVPFVSGAFTRTDDASSASMRMAAGTVCMSGRIASWAHLVLGLSPSLSPQNPIAATDQPFDATALGIAQVELTLDSPPSTGISPTLVMRLLDSACEGDDCPLTEEFMLMDANTPVTVRAAVTLTAPFTDFLSPNMPLDPSRLLGLHFNMLSVEQLDFCVRDVKFLDDNGVEVTPPA